MVLPNIAPTPSSPLEDHHIDWIPEPVCQNAQRLFVLLHVCGPKNTAGDEWTRSLDTVILSIHRTADKVFRALIEDWRSASVNNNIPSSDLLEGVVSDQRPTPLALPPWLGIFAGIERLDSLLHTVHAFLASATSAAIVLPLGSILDLSDRIISALPPSKDKNVRTRPEIGRDEREGLWLGLPKLHISALGILSLTISRLGCGFVPAAYSVLDQVLWLLECEHVQSSVRMTCYGLVSQILTAFGLSLPRSCALSLSRCIKLCCEDLLPSNDLLLQNRGALVSDGKNIGNRTASATNADLYLKGANTHTRPSDAPAEVVEAARKLLSLTLTHLPNGYLAFSLRSQIDRTAILTNNKDAMLASVMNPVTKKNGKVQVVSILPFLARVYPRSLEVESLLRPQMPVVQPRLNELGDDLSEEDDKLYMHERPTNGMPTEIGSYGAGATDSRSAQQDTITSGYEDALSPAKSMVEAIVPCTRLSDRADVITMESTEANLSASTKRAREDSPKSVTQHLAASTMENQQAMGVGGNKRLRIAPNETEQTDSENHLPTDIPGIDRQDGESAALEPPMTEVFNTVSSRPALQQQGSDESDFEMPILDLEPGSDEEDEEEIDQEDDDDD